jgi:hypothetical protein
MILEKASYKAIKYACLKFHYAKRLPSTPMVGYNVFNEKRQWCGVIVFNNGLTKTASPFGLNNGQVCELVRVALNGKQSKTTKAVSLAVRLFKKANPLVRLLVSFADSDENHKGVIYQAMNWYFIGSKKTSNKFFHPTTGKQIHSRSCSSSGTAIQFGRKTKVFKRSELIEVKKGVKHKYIYPLTKDMRKLCEKLSKPYPK